MKLENISHRESVMQKIRTWLLIKIAGGMVVAINCRLAYNFNGLAIYVGDNDTKGWCVVRCSFVFNPNKKPKSLLSRANVI